MIITGAYGYTPAAGYIAAVSNTTDDEGNRTALYLLDVASGIPLLNTSLSGHHLSHHCSYGSQCVSIYTVAEVLIVQVPLEDGIWIVDIRINQLAGLYLNSMGTIDTSCATLHIGNTVKETSLILCTNADRLLAYNIHLDVPYTLNSPVELTTLPPDYQSAMSNIIESQYGTLHFFIGRVYYQVDNLTISMETVLQNVPVHSVQLAASSRSSENVDITTNTPPQTDVASLPPSTPPQTNTVSINSSAEAGEFRLSAIEQGTIGSTVMAICLLPVMAIVGAVIAYVIFSRCG